MTGRGRQLLRSVATKSVIAVLPIAMASAYASNSYVPSPPRLAAYDYLPVAEITVDSTTVGLADSSLYFLTDPTLTIDPAQVAKHLDEMQALGVDNIRVYVPWRFIETTKGQYDWSSMDVIMSLAADRNMGVLAAINTTPQWVDPLNEHYFGAAHPEPADFTQFVTAFATKYGSTVSAYEIWNEPNYVQFYDPVDPAAYAELLKAVYPGLKAIDPTATIVAAGLGHSYTALPTAMSPVEFVRGMYTAGAKGYFDALAYHPYQESTPFSQGTPDDYALDQALAMVALMASNGDYVTGPGGSPLLDANGQPITKKIWATEYGLATSRVTYAHQAAYIQDFLNTWATQTWAGPAYIYTTVDSAPGTSDPEGNFGVYTVDAAGNWVKKPAAQVLADWILAHPNQTFDPTGPTNPTGQANPLQALAALVQQFVQQVIHVISHSFIGAIVQAITTWIGSFATPAVATAAPSSLRVASAEASIPPVQADPPKTAAADAPTARHAPDAVAAPEAVAVAVAAKEDVTTAAEAKTVDAPVTASAKEHATAEPVAVAEPAVRESTVSEAPAEVEAEPEAVEATEKEDDAKAVEKTTAAKTTAAETTADKTDGPQHPPKPKPDNDSSAKSAGSDGAKSADSSSSGSED